MPEHGDTKRAYCATCRGETLWQYTVIQMVDGVFGLQNLFSPESNQKRFWRCTSHTDSHGNTLERFKKKENND